MMNTFISEQCKKNINFDYIFEQITPVTKYGNIIKSTSKPFLPGQEEELLKELEKVDAFYKSDKKSELSDILKEIRYIQETLQRAKNNVVLDEVELFEIKKHIVYSEKLVKSLRGCLLYIYDDLMLKPMPHLYELLDPNNQKLMSFYIYDEYSKKLADTRKQIKFAENTINNIKRQLKRDLEEKYSIKFNLHDEVTVNKINKELVDGLSNDINLRVTGENYLTTIYGIKNNEEIDDLTHKLEIYKQEEDEEELRIRKYLTQRIKENYDDLVKNAEKVGRIDYLLAKAIFAEKTNSIMPTITKDLNIEIKNGYNLKLLSTLKEKKRDYTPISVNLHKNVVCITGANMGGKTISLRMVGQIISLVAYGMFVPCESARVCLFNHIHISVGDDQSIEKGLSTFGAEIVNLKTALEDSDKRSLILIDELAGGTNPKEGYAITKAVVEYLKGTDSLSIITTHYDNIANDKDILNLQVAGLKIPDSSVEYKDIEQISKYMSYELIEIEDEKQTPRDALNIARLAGIPKQIIDKAMNIIAIS